MTSVVFHSQLASIMDVLAKAAVAEICKLVDDGYAVLRLEISRGQKENQTLKRRLQTMELMIARGSTESEVAAGEGSVNSLCDGVPMWEDEVTRFTDGTLFTSMARPFDSQLGIRVWKDGDAPSVDKNPAVQPTTGKKKSVDKAERRKESQQIKEERLEEELEHGGLLEKQRMNEERVKLVADGGEASPVVAAQIKSAEGKEKHPGQHRTRSSVWEDGGLDTDLKKEPENESVNEMLQDAGSEHISGKLNNLGYQYVMSERPSQLETFFTQASIETETEDPACSYTTEADSESLPISSELQSITAAWKFSGNSLSSAESFSVKQGTIMMDSEPFKVEVDMGSVWHKQIMSRITRTQDRDYREHSENEEVPLQNSTSMCALPPRMAGVDNVATNSRSDLSDVGHWDKSFIPAITAHHRGGTAERFICTYCGKSFTCQNVFETHQRLHTGEKPFKCSQCEKRFAQLRNLLSHRRVHTGEKPYKCTLCEKRFAQLSNLINHQRVHTGEKPFRCTQCGKRFARSYNLKIHQSVHTGQKPFRCSHCGKSFTTSSHRRRHESVHNVGSVNFPHAD